MTTHRVYFIGAGVISRTHAAGAQSLQGGAELHLFDPSAPAVAAFLAEYPEARSYESLAAMLDVPAREDDVVVIATPPSTHATLAVAALDSGRHVLCEKPLATSVEEARHMVAAARAAGRHVADCSVRFVGYGAAKKLSEMLEQRSLGDIYQITARHKASRGRSGIEYQPQSSWFLDRSKSGGGVGMDWSVYDLTTVFDVVRPERVEIVSAFTAKPKTSADPTDRIFDVETHVGAVMRLHSTLGTINFNYERASATHGSPSATLELEGTCGAVTWTWLPYQHHKTAIVHRFDLGDGPETTEYEYPTVDALNFHHRPLHFFADFLAGKPNGSLIDGRALMHFKVIQAIYGVAETGIPVVVEIGDE